jgi:hypothetical protein
VIEALKSEPEIPRSELTAKIFASTSGPTGSHNVDEEKAINLAVRAMFTINCSAQHQLFHLLEHGADRLEWRGEVAFAEFISGAFPMTDYPSLNDNESPFSANMKKDLMARKLRKVAGLTFQPTDNLRNHLRLEHQKIY